MQKEIEAEDDDHEHDDHVHDPVHDSVYDPVYGSDITTSCVVCVVTTLWLNAVLVDPKAKAHPVIKAEIKDSTSRYIVVNVLSTCLSANQDCTVPEVKDLNILNPL